MSLYRRVYEINEMSSLENIVDSSSHIKFKRGDVFVGDEEVLQIDRDASIRRIFEEFIGNKLVAKVMGGHSTFAMEHYEIMEKYNQLVSSAQPIDGEFQRRINDFESAVGYRMELAITNLSLQDHVNIAVSIGGVASALIITNTLMANKKALTRRNFLGYSAGGLGLGVIVDRLASSQIQNQADPIKQVIVKSQSQYLDTVYKRVYVNKQHSKEYFPGR